MQLFKYHVFYMIAWFIKTLLISDQGCVSTFVRYLKFSVWGAHLWIQALKGVGRVRMMDSRLLTPHYTLLIIFALYGRGGRKGSTSPKKRQSGGGGGGWWRKERGWGRAEATEEGSKATNNHHKSSSSQHFHMLRWPVIGSSLGSVCTRVCILCVCMFAPSFPSRTSLHSLTVFASP